MDKPSRDAEALTSAEAHQTLIPDPRLRLIVFAFLMAGVFMATLDVQIIATALPTIVGEFGHIERFGWVGSAYLLTSSAIMPIYGKLGDLFGRKYTVMTAIGLFVLGSLTCGLAVSMDTLIAARVLQALGGGGIMVSIFSINADLFAPRERAKYQSYSSLMLMASGFIGPVLGGTMSDLFGWRSIFLINLPIGIVVLLGLGLLFPNRRPDRKPKIDYAGALLLAGVTASIVLWADGSELFGGLFSPLAIAVIGAGAICLVFWVRVERRVPEPVIPLSLFANPTIARLLIISVASGSIGIGMVNYIALYLQSTLSMSPTAAGLFFIPLTGGIAAGSITAGRIMSRTGRYKIFSILSMTTCLVALLSLSLLGPETPLILAAAILLVDGIGIGVGQQVPILGIQNAADRRDVGAATGSATLTRMGGASIAISIYGAIVAAGLAPFATTIPGVPNLEKLSPDVLSALPSQTQQMIGLAYQQAFHPLFLVAAGYALVGLLTAISLRNVQMPVRG
ncbi:Multidrug-efflux transporter 3 [Hartmannibacter diazotrophicus]|uniref:Multidrug-efflux transporter 3 n=1 Tax=Hartmannibacter diazotrophicus TaxID=1482074 RepID=A0A2C9DB18_9HYPH|nr:MDR family MFS transporter [Hartmannibacter diazotrophicus]SON57487.1 Multidrug-efflux transporter 3 [Hartmannibacter diazotrophicus]